MLNLVHEHYQEGSSTSEEELRSVLGRKELPKWFTYLNYLLDSDLITITEKGNYVLKRDLDHITLWDFYRTLPYPLPIKDEIDDLSANMDTPWLSLLTQRFKDTEKHAKHELDIPLSDIFENSLPREGVKANKSMFDDADKKANSKNSDSSQSDKEDFEAEAYDPDAKVVEDNQNKEAVMPPDADLKSNNNSDKTVETSTHKAKKRGGLLGVLSHDRDEPIITEDDNPNKD